MNDELRITKQALIAEERRRKAVEHERDVIKKVVPESEDEYEVRVPQKLKIISVSFSKLVHCEWSTG